MFAKAHPKALREKVRQLPQQPGVYRFLSARGKIIYIGKAKNLRKRVSSYFVGGRKHSYRISHLVDRIRDLEYTVVNSEIEALLLENNLIKTHQPKYNILLKDGKTYPYICIKNERFPRVFATRNRVEDGSRYFGPYPSVGTMNSILDLVRGFIQLRTCNYHLSEENIATGKFRACMEYQIGNCGAPCVGKVSEATYNAGIDQILHILKGNFRPITELLEVKMNAAAADLDFEGAEYFRRKIEKVNAYKRKNTVVSPKVGDLEVLTVMSEEGLALVNHFRVRNGSIVGTHTYEHRLKNQEEDREVLAAALGRLLGEQEEIAREIVTNEPLTDVQEIGDYRFTIPQRGDKKHLVDLSLKNCKTLLIEKLYAQNFRQKKTPGMAMVEALQKALNLKVAPDHIECIDNSNFHGEAPVSSLVVFKDGKASKKDYRHFNVKTVVGSNDFATMEEIVHRRMRRLQREDKPFPKLLVVDGGKGQLSSAVKALRALDLFGKVPVIGIAKRLEEIYVPGDPIPLHIDKKSPALRLIQQMRDEAHRFAITHHRSRRAKARGTALVNVKGIGEKSAKAILKEFKSLKKLKAASPEELNARIGAHKAQLILNAIERGEI